MHVLWLIPDYYTFLVEEMAALVPHVEELTVISQARPAIVRGVTSLSTPRIQRHMFALAQRGRDLWTAWNALGRPVRGEERRLLASAVRQSTFIREYVRKNRVDLIHSHFADPAGTAGFLASDSTPIVLTLRGVDLMSRPEIGYGLRLNPQFDRHLRVAVSRAAVVTVASRQSLGAAEELGPTHRALRVLPNGVDLRLFTPGEGRNLIRQRHKLGGDLVLLTVGNLEPLKRVQDVVRALGSLRSAGRTARLLVVGDGSQRQQLELLAHQEGASESVAFVGRVDRAQMPSYYDACDIFVHPSAQEGFGNVVLEAMAMGKVVVARRTGAAADLIRDGDNGILAGSDDEASLREAVLRAVAELEGGNSMGNRARESVAASLSLDARARAFRSIYEELVPRM